MIVVVIVRVPAGADFLLDFADVAAAFAMGDCSLLGTAPYRKKAVEIMAALSGRTIALPETRELDRLAQMLAEEGATTLRCPLIAIKDAPDQGPVEAWLRALAAGGMDDVIFLTGEGLRRLLAAAERIGLRAEVIAALARARKITRGPKPARALKEIGLSSDLPRRCRPRPA